jgi:hypothetical protein
MSQELINERLKKVQDLRDLGIDPYGSAFSGKLSIIRILAIGASDGKGQIPSLLTIFGLNCHD